MINAAYDVRYEQDQREHDLVDGEPTCQECFYLVSECKCEEGE